MPNPALKLTNPPLLIMVSWLDAVSDSNDWVDMEDRKPLPPSPSFTTGFLIDLQPFYLSLCSTYNCEDSIASQWSIPFSMITSIDILTSKQKLRPVRTPDKQPFHFKSERKKQC